MRFLANKSELLPLARRLNLAIGRQFLSAEKSCVLMEADAATNTVVFTARGEHCTLQLRHACRVEQEGKAMLFGGVFQRMIELFQDEATMIETQDKSIVIRNKLTVYEFALMNADKYPKPEISAPERLIDGGSLPEIASKVLFSVARGGNQSALTCVHVVAHEGSFCAESCDGFRLTVSREAAATDEPFDFLLSDAVMKTLLEILRGIPACKFGMTDGTFVCLAPNLIFTAERPRYQYINLQKIIESVKPEMETEVDGGALFTELNRVGVGSRAGARIVLKSIADGVSLLYTSGDREPLHTRTECAANVITPLPAAGFCYHYAYLLDAAKLIRGQTVKMQFDRAGYLMLKTEHEMHILLPVRMPKQTAEKPKKKPRKKAA